MMTWWRDAVVYQIYPRSFSDTDGDGVGDLNGVRERLPYLAWLGVDAIWLSPIFPSPMRDFGYDVADYVGVDPVFGSLDEFDALVREAHALGVRVLLDWVPNHTSSDHPWFIDARSSRESKHRNWYVWRDGGPEGQLPNNWVRAWSEEPAWTWDGETGQYYLHCFLPSQPDLNWDEIEVRRAMHDTLRFWLDRGVDGFRMDVIHLIGKELESNDREDLRLLSHVPLNDVAVTHDYLREIREVIDGYEGDRVSVGEVYLFDPDRVAAYYGNGDELHLSFNFAPLFAPWRAAVWLELIERSESALFSVGAWPTWVLSNHDNARVATRLGGDPQRVRAAMMLLLTLRGTPFLYAGEELGMRDAVVARERKVDPGGRDGCRSPVPWTRDPGHGWPSPPWLPFAEGATEDSVEAQRERVDSMLNFTRRVLSLRKSHETLRRGALHGAHVEHDVLVFDRVFADERLRVMVNFSNEVRPMRFHQSEIVLTSDVGAVANELAPGAALVLNVSIDSM